MYKNQEQLFLPRRSQKYINKIVKKAYTLGKIYGAIHIRGWSDYQLRYNLILDFMELNRDGDD